MKVRHYLLLGFGALGTGVLIGLFEIQPAVIYGTLFGATFVAFLAIGIPTRFGRRPWPWGERARQMQAGSQQHRERAA